MASRYAIISEDCRIAMSIAADSDTHGEQRLSNQTSPTTAQMAKERPAQKSLFIWLIWFIWFVWSIWLIRFVSFIWFIWLVLFNKINQTNETDQMNQRVLALMRHSP